MIPIKGQTRIDWVVDRLLDLIRTEGIRVGERVPPELELAHRFGVGRTTVREGLRILAATGVIRRTKRGTTVEVIPPAATAEELHQSAVKRSVQDLYEARRVLEAAMASLAAERATATDLSQMRKAIARLATVSPDNWQAIVEADVEFHIQVARAARNEVLAHLFSQVRSLLVKRLPPPDERAHSIQNAVARHWEVYQAIASRNPTRAAEIMVRNMTTSEQELLREK